MNKKLILKSQTKGTFYCVLDDTKELVEQLKDIFGFSNGNGMTVDIVNNQVQLIDFYHWSCVAEFDIISFEDTNEEVTNKFIDIK